MVFDWIFSHWPWYFSCTRPFIDLCHKFWLMKPPVVRLHKNCYVPFVNFCQIFVEVILFYMFQIWMAAFPPLHTRKRLPYLWQVARAFSPLCLCFVYYCIRWLSESSAVSAELLSAVDARNIHYNTPQTQARALAPQRQNLQPYSFLFCILDSQKNAKQKRIY